MGGLTRILVHPKPLADVAIQQRDRPRPCLGGVRRARTPETLACTRSRRGPPSRNLPGAGHVRRPAHCTRASPRREPRHTLRPAERVTATAMAATPARRRVRAGSSFECRQKGVHRGPAGRRLRVEPAQENAAEPGGDGAPGRRRTDTRRPTRRPSDSAKLSQRKGCDAVERLVQRHTEAELVGLGRRGAGRRTARAPCRAACRAVSPERVSVRDQLPSILSASDRALAFASATAASSPTPMAAGEAEVHDPDLSRRRSPSRSVA